MDKQLPVHNYSDGLRSPRTEIHKHDWQECMVRCSAPIVENTEALVYGWACVCGRVCKGDTDCGLCGEHGGQYYVDVRGYRCRDRAACARRVPQPPPQVSRSNGTPKQNPYLSADRISGTILYQARVGDNDELVIAAAEIIADERRLPVEIIGISTRHIVNPTPHDHARTMRNKEILFKASIAEKVRRK